MRTPARRQGGATAVELALILALFLTILLGVMEFGRYLFAWNSAVEATRWGARLAVVCDMNDADIRARMKQMLPQLQDANVSIDYQPGGCDISNCQSVTVTISGFTLPAMISPFVSLVMPSVPSFSTTLPRESMESVNTAGEINPVCQ